ncbi:MAG: GNAT family N-acetyltransferase [Anaerolineae bacterium]
MNDSISIQPLQPQHAAAAARIHRLSQEGTFLTALGGGFLTVLYEEMSRSKHSLAFVALARNEVIGFVVGTLSTGAIFKEVALKRPFRLGWLVLRRALKRPRLLWQAAQTLAYPVQANHPLPPAELLSLALEPRWRNRRIGSALVSHLYAAMRRAGVAQLAVTVDAANGGALRFYARHGFKQVGTSEMYGRKMEHLVWTLNEHDERKPQGD